MSNPPISLSICLFQALQRSITIHCVVLAISLKLCCVLIICISPEVFRSNTQNNIYVKIKVFSCIKLYINKNFRFRDLYRIFNFCPIASIRLFNRISKYRDVACSAWMGGTYDLRAETQLASDTA